MFRGGFVAGITVGVCAMGPIPACGGDGGESTTAEDDASETTSDTTGGAEEESEETSSAETGDTGDTAGTDDTEAGTDGDTGCEEAGCETCEPPAHAACDGSGSLPLALGLNCEGELQTTVSIDGNPAAAAALGSFGGQWEAREGTEFVALGSGFIVDLQVSEGLCGAEMDLPCCNRDLDDPFSEVYDPGFLPEPIDPQDVGSLDCADDPSLVGQGDCSNSLQDHFGGLPADAVQDYTELRVTAVVPESVTSLRYDFAFLSAEYPANWEAAETDALVVWVESERWTGNVSFDVAGRPVSVNASFFDVLDADTIATDGEGLPHPMCPDGAQCVAESLQDTCMAGHGATAWMTTTVPVVAGEEMTVVFAVADLGSSGRDSYAFIDDWRWGCESLSRPVTAPAR